MDPRLVVARSFTDEQRRQYVYAIGRGLGRTAAAQEVGVSLSTVRRALEADAALRSAVEEAEADKWSLAEDKLYAALEEGEPWAVRLVVKEAAGLREKWRPAAEQVEIGVLAEIGPGLERTRALEARLRERAALVLDVESEEPPPGE